MGVDFCVCLHVCAHELNIKHVGEKWEGGRHSLNTVSKAMLDGNGDQNK